MKQDAGYLKRQKERRNIKAFNGNIGGDATEEFALPANMKIFGRTSNALDPSEDYVASINGTNFSAPITNRAAIARAIAAEDDPPAPSCEADVYFPIGYYQRGTLFQAFANVELFYDAGLGRMVSIGKES